MNNFQTMNIWVVVQLQQKFMSAWLFQEFLRLNPNIMQISAASHNKFSTTRLNTRDFNNNTEVDEFNKRNNRKLVAIIT